MMLNSNFEARITTKKKEADVLFKQFLGYVKNPNYKLNLCVMVP